MKSIILTGKPGGGGNFRGKNLDEVSKILLKHSGHWFNAECFTANLCFCGAQRYIFYQYNFIFIEKHNPACLWQQFYSVMMYPEHCCLLVW